MLLYSAQESTEMSARPVHQVCMVQIKTIVKE